MKKEILKQTLINLIYTPDSKPRFINDNWCGGDVDDKLKRIDEAVEKIHSSFRMDLINQYLTQSDEDSDLPVEQQVEAIIKQSKIDGTEMIDYVDGVQTTEQFEFAFTCNDFLTEIS